MLDFIREAVFPRLFLFLRMTFFYPFFLFLASKGIVDAEQVGVVTEAIMQIVIGLAGYGLTFLASRFDPKK